MVYTQNQSILIIFLFHVSFPGFQTQDFQIWEHLTLTSRLKPIEFSGPRFWYQGQRLQFKMFQWILSISSLSFCLFLQFGYFRDQNIIIFSFFLIPNPHILSFSFPLHIYLHKDILNSLKLVDRALPTKRTPSPCHLFDS